MWKKFIPLVSILCAVGLLVVFFSEEIVTFFGGNRHKCDPENYVLPFTAAEVDTISVKTAWLKCKKVSQREEIEQMVSRMNGIQICSDYDKERDMPATGDWGHEFLVRLKNGEEYTYYTIPLADDTMLFINESGEQKKVHNFDSHKIWDELDCEIQGDPLAETECYSSKK